MFKEIEIEIDGSVFTAALLEDKAPTICKAFWDALPLDSQEEASLFGAIHSSWSGELVNMAWKQDRISDFNHHENKTIYGSAGDISMLVTTLKEREIFLVYGTAQFRYKFGPLICSTFAKVTDKLDELANACRKFHSEGKKRVIFRKK